MAIEEPGVRATLAACGLLKFFECPLIWVQEYLLQFLIRRWSPDLHCFIVRGEQIPFTVVEDMYFMTGLPFCTEVLHWPADSCIFVCKQLDDTVDLFIYT
jgi:hypothetical protein